MSHKQVCPYDLLLLLLTRGVEVWLHEAAVGT